MFDCAYLKFSVAALKVLRKFFWFVKPAEAMIGRHNSNNIGQRYFVSWGMPAISLTLSLFPLLRGAATEMRQTLSHYWDWVPFSHTNQLTKNWEVQRPNGGPLLPLYFEGAHSWVEKVWNIPMLEFVAICFEQKIKKNTSWKLGKRFQKYL